MSAAKLLELAARVEAAQGADRELDCRIWAALEPLSFEACQEVVPDFDQWRAMRYTASLDAAMTLYVRLPERVPSNPRLATAEALRQLAEHARASLEPDA